MYIYSLLILTAESFSTPTPTPAGGPCASTEQSGTIASQIVLDKRILFATSSCAVFFEPSSNHVFVVVLVSW